jgi:hypothetical protein
MSLGALTISSLFLSHSSILKFITHLHHLSCATQCIQGGRLTSGRGGFLHPVAMVAHCLLIETESGLVLVDTGLGCNDMRSPKTRLSWGFLLLSNPVLDQRNTTLFQVGNWVIIARMFVISFLPT